MPTPHGLASGQMHQDRGEATTRAQKLLVAQQMNGDTDRMQADPPRRVGGRDRRVEKPRAVQESHAMTDPGIRRLTGSDDPLVRRAMGALPIALLIALAGFVPTVGQRPRSVHRAPRRWDEGRLGFEGQQKTGRL